MTGLTRELARHVAGTDYEALPARARSSACLSLLDALGTSLEYRGRLQRQRRTPLGTQLNRYGGAITSMRSPAGCSFTESPCVRLISST